VLRGTTTDFGDVMVVVDPKRYAALCHMVASEQGMEEAADLAVKLLTHVLPPTGDRC